MEKEVFSKLCQKYHSALQLIQDTAAQVHASVNQHYDKDKPYSFHLNLVAQGVFDYGHLVLAEEHDLLPLFFGAWFHDSIEDARLTYNDVLRQASALGLDKEQSWMAAEIVYALTNDKGRTRAERAGEKYYAGIRQTPYAPFVKMCDRLANTTYSCTGTNDSNKHMAHVYAKEMPHFLSAIHVDSPDKRFAIPQEMTDHTNALLKTLD